MHRTIRIGTTVTGTPVAFSDIPICHSVEGLNRGHHAHAAHALQILRSNQLYVLQAIAWPQRTDSRSSAVSNLALRVLNRIEGHTSSTITDSMNSDQPTML